MLCYFICASNFVIRLLPVVGQPFAVRNVHMGKRRLKGRILRAAGVHAESDLIGRLPHMADAHLREMLTILRTLDAEIVLPAAQPVPHGFDGRADLCGRPV